MKIDERSAWSLAGSKRCHPTDCSIDSRFEQILSKPGQRHLVALVNAETGLEVTYGQLNEQANQLARILVARIHRPGKRSNSGGDNIVAVRFLPGQELVVTLLAIFKAGLAYVPIAPNWPEGRIQHILEDCAPIMVITNTNARLIYRAESKVTGDNQREILQYEDLVDEAIAKKVSIKDLSDQEGVQRQGKGSTLYAVLYTSGSTGKPKGVRHLHRAALNRILWQWETFPYTEEEVCVFKTTLTFIDSVIEIWAPLLSGKRLVILPTKVTENVERFVETLEMFNIGRIFVVTSLVKSILAFLNLEKGRKRLGCVKIWECSAETVTKEVLLEFFDYFKSGHRISNFYGSTEMSDVTFETFTSSKEVLAVLWKDKVPIGAPVDNTKAYLLDNDMRPVAKEEVGALYISGKNLADGYVGDKQGSFLKKTLTDFEEEDEEAERIFGTLYKTGDFARIVNDRLYYEGRIDSQVKVRGHRVDLVEVEQAVIAVKGVTKASVLCYRPGESQQRVICYYTVEPGTKLGEVAMKEALATILPCYMIPRLNLIPSIPLLVNGKTDRQALLKMYEESLACVAFTFTEEDLKGQVTPAFNFQAKLVLESVASVVKDPTRKPTLADNFFDIGGNSINMVEVIGKILEHGFHISITDFVTSTDLRGVAIALTFEEKEEDIRRIMEQVEKTDMFKSVALDLSHKQVVLEMIARSFANKGDLTTLASIGYKTLLEQLEGLWEAFLKANLSIVVLDNAGCPIAACLNFDARSEEATPLCAQSAFSRNLPEGEKEKKVETKKTLSKEDDSSLSVVEFLREVEEPLKETHLPLGKGKFIYTSLLGTADHLDTSDNIKVALFMEQENIRIGKERFFQGIFTTNANRLTQMISRALGYEILSTIQVNQYEDGFGNRPFSSAPDDLVTEVAIKRF